MSAFLGPKEQYNYYYNRLYPLLKEGRIDFAQVAQKTGFKERKVRETILFRLTAGEVRQLFGKKEGCCYICNVDFQMSDKEPLCLNCLQTIDNAVQEQQLSIGELPPAARPRQEEPLPPTESGDLPDMIPRAQYEAMLQELEHYRRASAGGCGSAESAPSQPAPHAFAVDQPEAPVYQAGEPDDSVLGILHMQDEDVSGDDIELPPAQSQAPLRHFGFQRLKSRA